MNWYSLHKIAVYVSRMDAFPEYDEYSSRALESYITTLHELELKTHYVIQLKDYVDIIPRRKVNIIERFRVIGWRYFTICRDAILSTFEDWKSKHPIQDAKTWALAMWEMDRQSFADDEEQIQYILENGYTIGDPHWGISINKDDISEAVSHDSIKEEIASEFWSSYEYYENKIENFLEDSEYEEEYESSGMSPVDFMTEKEIEDEVLEYIYNTTDFDSYVSDYEAYGLVSRWDVLDVMAGQLYNTYMMTFGSQIEDVLKNIAIAERRLEEVQESDNISKMTIAVSLALNVMHVFGNILTDYGNNIVSKNYLDELAEGEMAPAWEQEAKDEFVIGRPPPSMEPEIIEEV